MEISLLFVKEKKKKKIEIKMFFQELIVVEMLVVILFDVCLMGLVQLTFLAMRDRTLLFFPSKIAIKFVSS